MEENKNENEEVKQNETAPKAEETSKKETEKETKKEATPKVEKENKKETEQKTEPKKEETNKKEEFKVASKNKSNNENKNTGLIVIIIILVLIIIAGGIYGYMEFSKRNGNNNQIVAGNTQSSDSSKKEDKDKEKDEDKENTTKENTTKDSKKNDKKKDEEESSSSDAKVSTADSPLKLNQWGLASKRVSKYLSEEYADVDKVDVPVRVTKVTRGEEAEEIIKEWIDSKKYYKYQEPKKNTEWAVFDYEVDLSKLTFDEGTIGVDSKVDSGVKGLDGKSVKYNDVTYILTTQDMSDSEYKKEPGVYKGKFAVMLPEGCKDYLVTLGSSYEGTQSFFKVEE